MERTWVYILSSVVVSLSGIVLLLAQQGQAVWVSIATSLIAGGLASSAFATIRYFDDRDVRQTAAEIKYGGLKWSSRHPDIVPVTSSDG